MKKKLALILSITAAGVILFFAGGIYFNSDNSNSSTGLDSAKKIAEKPLKTTYRFGLPVDSFEVVESVVKSGESFGNILLENGVGYEVINKIATGFKDVFDVRWLRSGKPYSLFCEANDSSRIARYMVYQSSAVDYYVFDLKSTGNVYKGQKEVTTETKEVSGEINSSLYQSLIDKGASPDLTMRLADMYAWSIDFFRIQKGDYFKVIYEEQFIDDTVSVGVGRILAADFNHSGESFYSFYFKKGDEYSDYFDENGKTLRKAFLKAPLQFSRISSRYSPKRFHPVLKRMKAHLGTDYAAPHGTPIMATATGEVIAAGYTGGNGNYVKIKHNATYTTQYLHMSKFATGMRKGKRVKQGDVIGYVGSTGLATGPHVCYRFWKNGKQVDPLREKLPQAEPVKAEYMAEYQEMMQELKVKLDDMPVERPMKKDVYMASIAD
jgi:murein DD-endopeptidase MepM/ murein hydrolase activator NlpD